MRTKINKPASSGAIVARRPLATKAARKSSAYISRRNYLSSYQESSFTPSNSSSCSNGGHSSDEGGSNKEINTKTVDDNDAMIDNDLEHLDVDSHDLKRIFLEYCASCLVFVGPAAALYFPGLVVDGNHVSIPITGVIKGNPKNVELQNPNWNAQVLQLAERAISSMTGCSELQVRKWSINITNCRVLFQDSRADNEDNHFDLFKSDSDVVAVARLVIQLPSVVEGGALSVLDNITNKLVRCDFGEGDGSNSFENHCVCYLMDAPQGQMEEIRQGHRVLFVYDLVWDINDSVEGANVSGAAMKNFEESKKVLTCWSRTNPSCAFIALSRMYNNKNLKKNGISALEGEDKRMVTNITNVLNPQLEEKDRVCLYVANVVRTIIKTRVITRYYNEDDDEYDDEHEEGKREEEEEEEEEEDTKFHNWKQNDLKLSFSVEWLTCQGQTLIARKKYRQFCDEADELSSSWVENETLPNIGLRQYLVVIPNRIEASVLARIMSVSDVVRTLDSNPEATTLIDSILSRMLKNRKFGRSKDVPLLLGALSLPRKNFAATEQLKMLYSLLAAHGKIENLFYEYDDMISALLESYFRHCESGKDENKDLFVALCMVINERNCDGVCDVGTALRKLMETCAADPTRQGTLLLWFLQDFDIVNSNKGVRITENKDFCCYLQDMLCKYPDSTQHLLLEFACQTSSGCVIAVDVAKRLLKSSQNQDKNGNDTVQRALHIISYACHSKIGMRRDSDLITLAGRAFSACVAGCKLLKSVLEFEDILNTVQQALSTVIKHVSETTVVSMLTCIANKKFDENSEIKCALVLRVIKVVCTPGFKLSSHHKISSSIVPILDINEWKLLKPDIMEYCKLLDFGGLMKMHDLLCEYNLGDEAAREMHQFAFSISDVQSIQQYMQQVGDSQFTEMLDQTLQYSQSSSDLDFFKKLVICCCNRQYPSPSATIQSIAGYAIHSKSTDTQTKLMNAFGLDAELFALPPEVPPLPNRRMDFMCRECPELEKFMHSEQKQGSITFQSVQKANQFYSTHKIDGVSMLPHSKSILVSKNSQSAAQLQRNTNIENIQSRLATGIAQWLESINNNEIATSASKRAKMMD